MIDMIDSDVFLSPDLISTPSTSPVRMSVVSAFLKLKKEKENSFLISLQLAMELSLNDIYNISMK